MPGLTLDAGALIAFERNDRTFVALIARALELRHSLAVPAGVVGQVCVTGALADPDHPTASACLRSSRHSHQARACPGS